MITVGRGNAVRINQRGASIEQVVGELEGAGRRRKSNRSSVVVIINDDVALVGGPGLKNSTGSIAGLVILVVNDITAAVVDGDDTVGSIVCEGIGNREIGCGNNIAATVISEGGLTEIWYAFLDQATQRVIRVADCDAIGS